MNVTDCIPTHRPSRVSGGPKNGDTKDYIFQLTVTPKAAQETITYGQCSLCAKVLWTTIFKLIYQYLVPVLRSNLPIILLCWLKWDGGTLPIPQIRRCGFGRTGKTTCWTLPSSRTRNSPNVIQSRLLAHVLQHKLPDLLNMIADGCPGTSGRALQGLV